MTSFLGVPVMIRGEAYGNLYLTDKHGGAPFDAADEQLLTVLSEWAAVAIENARLYERAESRRTELERIVVSLRATESLGRELGTETQLARVLELVAKRGRALLEARAALVLLPEGDRLAVAEAAGELPDDIVGRSAAIAESPAGAVFRSGRSATISGANAGRDSGLGIAASAVVLVPLRYRGQSHGVLAACDPAETAPGSSADDELLLVPFAASAASALAMVAVVRSEKRSLSIAASERERRRWARELHDETLQQLGALRLMHDSALQRGDTDAMRRSLERASAQLEETIDGLEALIAELRPAVLDDVGLAAALDSLIERTTEMNGLERQCEIDLAHERGDEANRLAPDLEATIYRLVQEALNNVVKHAGAHGVEISIREENGAVSITVADDGAGFDPNADFDRFGSIGMRERVRLVGGELTITSSRHGTRVAADLPVTRADGSIDGPDG
jgi:signal transduction histidine kinase